MRPTKNAMKSLHVLANIPSIFTYNTCWESSALTTVKVYCRVFGSTYLTKNQNFEPGLKDWSALSESMSQQPQSSAEQVP